MKRALAAATAMLLMAPALPTLVASPAAAATVVVKHGDKHTVVVRRSAGRPNHIMWHRPPARPGHFWHRGGWFVRVHGPVFHYPHGWHHRVWVVGAILPPLFLTADYFYDDYATLGLQAPAPGYRWVRYGDDLLLVNLRTGEVEDVAYDVFD